MVVLESQGRNLRIRGGAFGRSAYGDAQNDPPIHTAVCTDPASHLALSLLWTNFCRAFHLSAPLLPGAAPSSPRNRASATTRRPPPTFGRRGTVRSGGLRWCRLSMSPPSSRPDRRLLLPSCAPVSPAPRRSMIAAAAASSLSLDPRPRREDRLEELEPAVPSPPPVSPPLARRVMLQCTSP